VKVEVRLTGVENLKVEAKQRTHIEDDIPVTETVKKVTFECQASPGELARVISLMDRGAPIYCLLGSDQAVLDLRFEAVDAKQKEKEPLTA